MLLISSFRILRTKMKNENLCSKIIFQIYIVTDGILPSNINRKLAILVPVLSDFCY